MRRAQFDEASQPTRNILTDPSFEASSGNVVARTNLAVNPSFEAASSTVNVRTNLATNPSFEATGAATTVRTNLAKNPSFEASSGTTNVRVNLATNPSMETATGSVVTRTNLWTNPSLAVNSTGYTTYGGGPTFADTTMARVAAAWSISGWAMKLQGSATSTPNMAEIGMGDHTLAPGTVVTGSVYVIAGATRKARLRFRGIGAGGDQWSPDFTLNAATPTRMFFTVTVPVGATGISFGINQAAVPDTFGASDWIAASMSLLEISNGLLPFFDGTYPAHENLVKVAPSQFNGATITTGVSYAGSTWSRLSTPANAAGPMARQMLALAELRQGERYTAAVTIANDQIYSQQVTLDMADTSQTSVILAPGETRRIIAYGTRTFYDNVFRFSDLDITASTTEARSVLFKDWIVEVGNTAGDYYTGTGDYTYAWSGTAGNSTSTQRALGVATWSSAASTVKPVQSITTKSHRLASLMVLGGPDGNRTAQTTVPVVVGKVYTVSADMRHNSGVSRELRFDYTFQDAGGARIGNYNAGPTVLVSGNAWGRRSTTTIAAPANAATITVYAAMIGGISTETFWVDAVMLEESTIAQSYFDGGSSASGDFTYAWSGAANASGSLQQAPSISPQWLAINSGSKVWQSNQNTVVGSKSGGVICDGSATGQGIYMDTGTVATYAAGEVYTGSATVTGPAGVTAEVVVAAVSGGINFTNFTFTGSPQRVSVSLTITAGALSGPYLLVRTKTTAQFAQFWVDGALLEKTSVLLPYFDGSSAAEGDFTYAWSGVSNASTSIQRGLPVSSLTAGGTHIIASTDWKMSGTQSLRIIPKATTNDSWAAVGGDTGAMQLGFVAGKTYTVSVTCRLTAAQTGTLHTNPRSIRFFQRIGTGSYTAVTSASAPNSAGVTRLSITHTITADATEAFIRLQNGATEGNGDVWWDDLLIEETPIVRPYFDGGNPIQNLCTNPSMETNITGWTSGANVTAASSTAKAYAGTKSLAATVITTGAATALVSTGAGPSMVPVNEGQIYTVSAYLQGGGSAATTRQAQVIGYFRDSANVVVGGYSGTLVAVDNNTWGRVYVTAQAPAGATNLQININLNPATAVASDIIYVDAILTEKSSSLNPYYEGTGDFTYLWSGVANASTSIQRAPNIATWGGGWKGYQSGVISKFGSKSFAMHRIHATQNNGYMTYNTLTPVVVGQTYTFSAWFYGGSGTYNIFLNDNTNSKATGPSTVFTAPGSVWTRYSHTFTATAAWPNLSMFVSDDSNASPTVGTTLYMDGIMLEQSALTDYFDGSTSASGDYTYNWTGTANASTSQQKGANVSSVTTANCVAVQSSDWAVSGKSVRIVPVGSNISFVYWTMPTVVGNTYTFSATARLAAPLAGTLEGRALRLMIRSGGLDLYSTPSPNTAGVVPMRLTFKAQAATTNFYLWNGASGGNGDVWYDNAMVTEGDYTGDYIDGSKPLAKWDGTPNASTSIGYPPQFLDIAGKPAVDTTAVGVTALPGGVDPSAPRTIYSVMQLNSKIPTGQLDTAILYGTSPMSDTVPNSYLTLRYQSMSGPNSTLLNRRTLGAGPQVFEVPAGINIVCWGVRNGNLFVAHDGQAENSDTGNVMSVGHNELNIAAPTSYHTHVRTIIYLAAHDAATRLAVQRYLGNKYGANIV